MGFIDWLPGRGKKAVLKGPGRFRIRVRTGDEYRDALESVAGGHVEQGAPEVVQARLVLEDSNVEDPKAVRVDVRDRTIGYLERDFARRYRTWLADAGYPGVHAYCPAVIRSSPPRPEEDEADGRREESEEGERLSVWLDLPDAAGNPRN